MLVAAQEAADYADFAVPAWVWLAFLAGFIGLLLVDVLVIHRTAHVATTRQAAIESAVWIAIGLSFSLVILAWQGTQAAGEYVAGYLIEESLSIDNVFVWALILSFFAVPRAYQHRVLFWGIFGALIARAVFIFGGVALLDHFDGVIYIFGAILLITAVRLLMEGESEVNPESNPLLRIFRRVIPSTTEYDGHRLLTRKTGVLLATPLLAVVVVVETSDVVFAVDSIPAILAVTREEFVVYTSNAFAILGLRALYFLLADLKDRFEYLRHGLAVILAFVGVKMLIAEWVYIPVGVSLAVIATVLVVSVVISARHDAVPGGDLEPADQHDE
ncbi:MAG: TerC family protein [Acidimicrobiales bacterium]